MALIDRTAFSTPRRSGLSLRAMYDVWTQRNALKSLDADALRDIGISAAQADAEAHKPLWDVPKTWRC